MTLPKQTGELFEILSKGQFICSDSTDSNTRALYKVLAEDEILKDYFNAINLNLEGGDEYFHFTRNESKVDLERKIEIAFKWIDIVDFLKAYDNAFGPGLRFTPSDILVKLNVDAILKSKIEGLRKHTSESSFQNTIQKTLDMLLKENFIELENPISNTFKVLSSFHYLEKLILSINIPDEVINEIPE
jgi:hypothetical protein